MKFNRIFMVSLIILAILTIGAVSALDNATSDDLSIGLEDGDVQESSIDEDVGTIDDNSDINEEITGVEETDNVFSDESEDIIGVEDNTVISKEVTEDEPVLASVDKDVLSDTVHIKIAFYKQTGKTAKDKKLYFKITNAKTGTGESFTTIQYEIFKNGKSLTWGKAETNARGLGVIDFSKIKKNIGTGTFVVKATLYDDSDLSVYYDALIESNYPSTKVKISGKQQVTIKPKKLSTSFRSGKYFKAKVIDSKTKKPVKGVKVILNVYTGKKAKKVTVTSSSKGIVKYSSSKLNVGKHKVVLKVKKSKYFKGKTKKSMIKISKAGLKVSAPKITKNYKKSALFKVTVKNKKSGKPVKGISVVMKVYTGKKYKTYKLKTNKKGKTGFNTKRLSKGKHKVVVIAKVNSKYKKATAKSSVTIKKPKTAKSKTSSKGKKAFSILDIKSASRTNGASTYYIKLILEDRNGHPLANKKIQIKTIIKPAGTSKITTGTTDSNGIVEGYIDTKMGGDTSFDITATFAGDSSYYASSVHAKLG